MAEIIYELAHFQEAPYEYEADLSFQQFIEDLSETEVSVIEPEPLPSPPPPASARQESKSKSPLPAATPRNSKLEECHPQVVYDTHGEKVTKVINPLHGNMNARRLTSPTPSIPAPSEIRREEAATPRVQRIPNSISRFRISRTKSAKSMEKDNVIN